MEARRAEEILRSSETIQVLYNNSPIWIESVDQGRQTATVTKLGEEQGFQVPVSALYESDR